MFFFFSSVNRCSTWDVFFQWRPSGRKRRGELCGMQWQLQICFLIKSFLEFQVWPWCHNEMFWPLSLLWTKIRLAYSNCGGFLSSLTLSQEFFFVVVAVFSLFYYLFLNAMQGLTGGLEGFVLFVVREWHSQVLHFKCSIAFVHKSTFPVFS